MPQTVRSSVQPVSLGVTKETAHRERRVALDPETTARLVRAATPVFIESGAGTLAGFSDASFATAGATVTTRDQVVAASDVLAFVRPPGDEITGLLHGGQIVLGLVDPVRETDLMARLADRGVTVLAFELLPRTLSRAQSMDAVSSQASAAGYRAGVLAAASFTRYFPMMVTASGTAKPAAVLVVGAGIAGLQAIAVAKRLGALVTGYDVRPASRGEVESLGARFLTPEITAGAGTGGYARSMTAGEAVRQQDELARHIVGFDVVITTAKVPGRTPPLLVTAATLAAMAPGSVCIDLAASDERGNVAGSHDGQTITTDRGVIVIGAGNLASELATSASSMFARNVAALFTCLAPAGVITVDSADEIITAVTVCHDGRITHPALAGSAVAVAS